MNFDDLVGKKFSFYGVDNNSFRLGTLDTGELLTYEAIEDPSDGYRSYLASVVIQNSLGLIFFSNPIASVVIEETDKGDFKGFELKDIEDNHVWLRFGTDNCDDYYPYFIFQYSAKAPG
jgi:hypothetical protein